MSTRKTLDALLDQVPFANLGILVPKATLRAAAAADAEAIFAVLRAAVEETASADYDKAIIRDWAASCVPEKLEAYKCRISSGEEVTVVAEIDGVIAGFGAIVEETNELRAVYVAPDAGRRGIGTLIVRRLEKIAQARGMKELQLVSSVTAERFYVANGYTNEGKSTHTLGSGREMDCIRMRKCF